MKTINILISEFFKTVAERGFCSFSRTILRRSLGLGVDTKLKREKRAVCTYGVILNKTFRRFHTHFVRRCVHGPLKREVDILTYLHSCK